MTLAEWRAEAVRRFGPDPMEWRFVCPACGHVAATEDWKAVGLPSSMVAFSCIGRGKARPREAFARGGGPCDYAGGGLIRLNPVTIVYPDGTEERAFAFAEAQP